MSAVPLFSDARLHSSAEMAVDVMAQPVTPAPKALLDIPLPSKSEGRTLSVYAPSAAFGLVEELVHLSQRAVEKNVFFDPRFLVPAMPRLDDRAVRLFVMRDESAGRSRLRMLMPYSVEKTGLSMKSSGIIRAWSHPFGPLGTLPLDGDDPVGTVTAFLQGLLAPELALPDMLVLPDLRIKGPMARAMLASAKSIGLPVVATNYSSRAALVKAYAGNGSAAHLSGKRRRDLDRGMRLLEAKGQVSFEVARDPRSFRLALEDFLILEASGWKGRQRSALISDRYRSAFAREALNALAGVDKARIVSLRLDGQAIASLILLVDSGEAYAWKSAYDERYAQSSPGQQVMAAATRMLLADPTIHRADSCAVPDHFVMNRFWSDRLEIGTLVVGLRPELGGRVEATARALAKQKRSKNMVRILRQRVEAALGLD